MFKKRRGLFSSHLFELLGEFPRQDHIAISVSLQDILQQFQDPVRRLIEDGCPLIIPQLFQLILPLYRLRREEPLKREFIDGFTRNGERRQKPRRAGYGDYGYGIFYCQPYYIISRIRYAGRAGIRDERDRPAAFQDI